eukprot:TRINITY_DN4406_c0_g3_i1.p1 TRINITY_DN4406_c0_g3~~TRINITY_DN4406_c0_g3_i1.p1  ORF type:complete len:1406 (-),score=219.62 TRINITY_DN4406_c0_g3_i1:291-4508(-)
MSDPSPQPYSGYGRQGGQRSKQPATHGSQAAQHPANRPHNPSVGPLPGPVPVPTTGSAPTSAPRTMSAQSAEFRPGQIISSAISAQVAPNTSQGRPAGYSAAVTSPGAVASSQASQPAAPIPAPSPANSAAKSGTPAPVAAPAPAATKWATIAQAPAKQPSASAQTKVTKPAPSSTASSSSSSSSRSPSEPDASAISARASLRASTELQARPHRIAQADESWIVTGYLLNRLAYVLRPIALEYWRIFAGVPCTDPSFWDILVKKSADMIHNKTKKHAPINIMHFQTNHGRQYPVLRTKIGTGEPINAEYVQDMNWAFELAGMFPPESPAFPKSAWGNMCSRLSDMRNEWAHRNSSHQGSELSDVFDLANQLLHAALQESADPKSNFPIDYLQESEANELISRAKDLRSVLRGLAAAHDYSLVIGFKSYSEVLKSWTADFEKRIDEHMDERFKDHVCDLTSLVETLDMYRSRIVEAEIKISNNEKRLGKTERQLASHSSSIDSNSAEIAALKQKIEALEEKLEESARKLERIWRKFAPEMPSGVEHWVGRHVELDSMQKFFSARMKSSSYCLLTGAHGLGKTSLAAQYAISHQNDYKYILWVEAHDQNSFRSSAINIVRVLRPDLPDLSVEVSALEEFWSIFENEPEILTVINNLDDEVLAGRANSSEVSGAFNSIRQKLKRARGHVIVTSIHSASKVSWVFPAPNGVPALTLVLNKFSERDAKDLFALKLPELSQSKEATLLEIASVLDYFPFALDVAASFIASAADGEESIDAFAEHLKTQPLEVLEVVKADGRSFQDLVQLAIESVTKATKAPLELLRILSCLQSIPVDFSIVRMISQLAQDPDPAIKALFAAFGELAALVNQPYQACTSRSLIHQDPATEAVSMHRLVQMTIWQDPNFSTADKIRILHMAAIAISKWSMTRDVTSSSAAHTSALAERILDLKGQFCKPHLAAALGPALCRLMEEKLWLSQWQEVLSLGDALSIILKEESDKDRLAQLYLAKKTIFMARKAEGHWPNPAEYFQLYEDSKNAIGEFHWVTFCLLSQAIYVPSQTQITNRVKELAKYLEDNIAQVANLDALYHCWLSLYIFYVKLHKNRHRSQAIRAIETAISIARQREENDPVLGLGDRLFAQSKLAELLAKSAKTAPEALRLIEPVIRHWSRISGGNNWEHALGQLIKCDALASLGDPSRFDLRDRALDICRRNPMLKSKIPYLLKSKAFECEFKGDFLGASESWREAYEIFRETRGEDATFSAKWKLSRALSLIELGKLELADKLLNQCYAFANNNREKIIDAWWIAFDIADSRYKVAKLMKQNAPARDICAAWDKLLQFIGRRALVFDVLFHFEFCAYLCELEGDRVFKEFDHAKRRLDRFLEKESSPCTFLLSWMEQLQEKISRRPQSRS